MKIGFAWDISQRRDTTVLGFEIALLNIRLRALGLTLSEAEARGKLQELIAIGETIFETYRHQVRDRVKVELGQ